MTSSHSVVNVNEMNSSYTAASPRRFPPVEPVLRRYRGSIKRFPNARITWEPASTQESSESRQAPKTTRGVSPARWSTRTRRR